MLGASQLVTKTFFQASPALAVPLIVFPSASLMPRILSWVACSLSGRLVLVLSLTVYSSPCWRSTPNQSSSGVGVPVVAENVVEFRPRYEVAVLGAG